MSDDDAAETRLVYCAACHKTHAVKLTDEPCAPGAWLDPTTHRPAARPERAGVSEAEKT